MEVKHINKVQFEDNIFVPAIFGPSALFSETKLATFSDEHLENFEDLHTKASMHKLSSSTKGATERFIKFDKSEGKRQRELTNIQQPKAERVFLQQNTVFRYLSDL